MVEFYWVCPFCNRGATIQDKDVLFQDVILRDKNNAEGKLKLECKFIVCPNSKCKQTSLSVGLSLTYWASSLGWVTGDKIGEWNLIPQSIAQSFPDYIPEAILDDYNEACLIKDLSPKASATLSRRCLQGIIRDFWKVKPGRLVDEIEQIKDKVDPDTWKAIDSVRSVGNIGAHMEEDINLIVDVEPNEAELLIGLIEILLRDWYIAREQKKSHLESIVQLATEKEIAKKTTT
ncbi:MAG: DUF4145 domain-containing protein [Dehalococcoidia bacterium]|nr:DUF4145 domain-containing protein [Dehalococcoidia bacterium]